MVNPFLPLALEGEKKKRDKGLDPFACMNGRPGWGFAAWLLLKPWALNSSSLHQVIPPEKQSEGHRALARACLKNGFATCFQPVATPYAK